MAKKYYDLDNLLACKCNWNILFGMRSNGKSYAVKKHVVKECYKSGRQFIYLRRWSEDIREKEVSSYFDDCPVNEITKLEWDGITAFRGFFYFYKEDSDGNQTRSNKPIGRYCSLNQSERYKSQVFNEIDFMIYEEFLTNRLYLGNTMFSEPRMLMQFVSTVARDRDIKIFMIGNTISRVCPYFNEWGLKNVMQQKPGTIDIYHLKGENGVVDIAVENCEVVDTKSKMFFGLVSKQIISGEWEVDEVPKLQEPYEFYDMLYEVNVKYEDFAYIMQLMWDSKSGGSFIYIYPNTKNRKVDRVITNEFSSDPLVSNGLKNDIRAEIVMGNLFREGKVCFSDNLTGTDFKQIVDQYNLRGVVNV